MINPGAALPPFLFVQTTGENRMKAYIDFQASAVADAFLCFRSIA